MDKLLHQWHFWYFSVYIERSFSPCDSMERAPRLCAFPTSSFPQWAVSVRYLKAEYEERNNTSILMTQVFFLSHCQAMRLVHLQTAKYRGALKKALKRHLVKIYAYSVLSNIICLTACFVEWCVAVGLPTWEKKREVNLQKLHVRAPWSHCFWNASWCGGRQMGFMGLQREDTQAWCKAMPWRRAFSCINLKVVSKWKETMGALLFASSYYSVIKGHAYQVLKYSKMYLSG